MQGVSFWVQREVNGSEHLLCIVAIIIKRLWVVEALQFVRLEGHYHMLWHSDDVARVCNSWATFPQHGIDLQICILYINGGRYFAEGFKIQIFCCCLRNDTFTSMWLPAIISLPWLCRTTVTTSLSLQSINTFCCDWCFSRGHVFIACLYTSLLMPYGFLVVIGNSPRTFVFMGQRFTEPPHSPSPASAENNR